MKNLRIQEPCSESWNGMTPNEKGAFCQKCAKSVIDFTGMSALGIKQTLLENSGQSICGRISTKQMDSLNNDFDQWDLSNRTNLQRAMVFSLLVVFGLSLFSCSTEQEKEHIKNMQHGVSRILEEKQDNQVIDLTKEIEVPRIEPEEVVIEDMVVGKMEYIDQVEQKEIEVLQQIEREYDYVTMGAMVCTSRYVNYLESNTEVAAQYDENGIQIPEMFVGKTFPNPATTETTLEIAFPEDNYFIIDMYSTNGTLIRHVFEGELKKGTRRYPVELNSMEPGNYFFSIRSKSYGKTVHFIKI